MIVSILSLLNDSITYELPTTRRLSTHLLNSQPYKKLIPPSVGLFFDSTECSSSIHRIFTIIPPPFDKMDLYIHYEGTGISIPLDTIISKAHSFGCRCLCTISPSSIDEFTKMTENIDLFVQQFTRLLKFYKLDGGFIRTQGFSKNIDMVNLWKLANLIDTLKKHKTHSMVILCESLNSPGILKNFNVELNGKCDGIIDLNPSMGETENQWIAIDIAKIGHETSSYINDLRPKKQSMVFLSPWWPFFYNRVESDPPTPLDTIAHRNALFWGRMHYHHRDLPKKSRLCIIL